MASQGDVFQVKYHGFIYIDRADGALPEPDAVQNAAKLLSKNKKTARAMHPLFARGLDTILEMIVGKNDPLIPTFRICSFSIHFLSPLS